MANVSILLSISRKVSALSRDCEDCHVSLPTRPRGRVKKVFSPAAWFTIGSSYGY